MILKVSIVALWQIKAIFSVLFRLWNLQGGQKERFFIVSEEWFTNCLKHGGKPRCWVRIQWYCDVYVVCFIDNGFAFNPFAKNEDAVGLRLMTKLLKAKYRRFKGRNVFEVCLAKN